MTQDGKRPNWQWPLRFVWIWLDTYRLKRRRAREQWSDARYYDEVYSLRPEAAAGETDKFAALRDAITDEILQDRAAARILDVGTGCGYQARSAREQGYRRVYACDLVPERLARARRLHDGAGIRFVRCDMQALGFASGSFDAVTISVALHDLACAEVARALGECARVLKPGGRLIVLEPRALCDLPRAWYRPVYKVGGQVVDESLHWAEFVERDLAADLAALGFALRSRAVVWHSLLCLYTFEKNGVVSRGTPARSSPSSARGS